MPPTDPDTSAPIQARGLSKRFGEVLAVDDLDLTVRRSEFPHANTNPGAVWIPTGDDPRHQYRSSPRVL